MELFERSLHAGRFPQFVMTNGTLRRRAPSHAHPGIFAYLSTHQVAVQIANYEQLTLPHDQDRSPFDSSPDKDWLAANFSFNEPALNVAQFVAQTCAELANLDQVIEWRVVLSYNSVAIELEVDALPFRMMCSMNARQRSTRLYVSGSVQDGGNAPKRVMVDLKHRVVRPGGSPDWSPTAMRDPRTKAIEMYSQQEA